MGKKSRRAWARKSEGRLPPTTTEDAHPPPHPTATATAEADSEEAAAPAPAPRGQISKRYREISMCTHPDKLLGHTADEVERGKLLFQRASEARDGLIAATRESAAAIERAAKADVIDGGEADGDGTAVQAEASCSTQ